MKKTAPTVFPDHIKSAIQERFVRIDDHYLSWFDLVSNDTRNTSSVANWIQSKFNFDTSNEDCFRFREKMRTANRVTYRPNAPRIFEDEEGYICANKWRGWGNVPGDVEPFLAFVRETIGASSEELAFILNTVAARMQRNDHIPYGLLFMGDLEAGTTLINCFAAAFGSSACSISSVQVFSKDRRWMNYSSLAVVRDGGCLARKPGYTSALGNIVLSPTLVNTGTSSKKATRRYETINRLLFVISAEPHNFGFSFSGQHIRPGGCASIQVLKPTAKTMENVLKWLKDPQSGAYLADWLLNRDLSKFEIPHFPPETQYEKILKNVHGRPFQIIAKKMRESDENACAIWISNSLEWADTICSHARPKPHDLELAQSIRAFMPELKISPFYTAKEIARMFPDALDEVKRRFLINTFEHAQMISMELTSGGLPILASEDPRGFLRAGEYENFFVVHDFDRWRKPLTQEEFDQIYASFGTYRDYVKLGTYGKVEKPKEEVPGKKVLWWRDGSNYR